MGEQGLKYTVRKNLTTNKTNSKPNLKTIYYQKYLKTPRKQITKQLLVNLKQKKRRKKQLSSISSGNLADEMLEVPKLLKTHKTVQRTNSTKDHVF